MTEKIKFNQILKWLLKYNNLTQKKLCEFLSIPEFKMSDYVRGIQEPSIEDISEIADAFQISTDKLLGKDFYFNEYLRLCFSVKKVIGIDLSVLECLMETKEVQLYKNNEFVEITQIDISRKRIIIGSRSLKFSDRGKVWIESGR